jgi:hypothetical protein
MWATFWVAVGCTAIFHPSQKDLEFEISFVPKVRHIVPLPFAAMIATISLCAAIGSIVGRQRMGILAGLIMAMGWPTILAFAIIIRTIFPWK